MSNTYNIKVNSMDEAQKLNRIAEKYPFDIWIHGKSGQADAKSILGLMLLTLESELMLVVEENVDVKHLEKDLADFLA
jgi:phosphotransferase system HPr-like phosphotransfer protein